MKYKIIKEWFMYLKKRQAFTMIELVFVIVVIGILSAIAIPKFAATRDDAIVTKAIATIGSVRSAIATERQKRILRGSFVDITSLGGTAGNDKDLFDWFDGNTTGSRVLEYPIQACASSAKGCWSKTSNSTYVYTMPTSGTVTFTFSGNRFTCPTTDANCLLLTK